MERLQAAADQTEPDSLLPNWSLIYRPSAKGTGRQPALFLDRDGVIIEDVNYISNPDDVRLIPGVGETIRHFRSAGFTVVVVTNQSGIARGYFDRAAYLRVECRIRQLLASDEPDAVYACPFHKDGLPPYNVDHPWRKPNDGMLRASSAALGIDLEKSQMVGDSLSDIQAGVAAGIARAVHVLTGHGRAHRPRVEQLSEFLDASGPSATQISCVNSIADVLPALQTS
ncbi:D-glycero-alpha-D-manno-heptose-1,7-bisphosphate 7-phosphatase [Ensifer adhaerens]|uniref:D-glycero-alpha-D-manno-heptose-1,7-bisphosphate 7-phosphatase n=1 Tax=Ensifer adhaerens TaxID=106592 RepID=UPI00098F8636|nr:HAD family hydrolase [Ensifer adhaerens]